LVLLWIMNGENRPSVIDELVEFWENNHLKFKTPSKSPIILEEFIVCTSYETLQIYESQAFVNLMSNRSTPLELIYHIVTKKFHDVTYLGVIGSTKTRTPS
jgi:hypothetical protein